MGCPGSGKTTFVRNHLKDNQVHISRDVIRFSLVKEEEEYFSKENEVFKQFIEQIDAALASGKDVFADATHLNATSRRKLINALSVKPKSIEVLWIKTSLEKALEQNENRKDTRSYVPRSAIKRMFYSIERPSFEEEIDKFYVVENGKIVIVEKEN